MLGLLGGVRGVLGAGRDSRYSGARRGIGHIGELLGDVGGCFGGVRGVLGLAGTLGT